MTPAAQYPGELLILKGVESLLLPPGLFCTLILFCLIFHQQKFSAGLLLFTGVLIYLSALPATRSVLSSFLTTEPLIPYENHQSQAIVVIGGGRHMDTPDFGGDTVNHLTLERLRYAAIVQKQTGLPILVSGGKPFLGHLSEAELMRDILNKEFLGIVNWIESNSRTTYENAQFSAPILKANGIHKIVLVTHAYHMPRAMEAFQHAGFTVTPAATIFFDRAPNTPATIRWFPSISASYWNNLILHELFGRLWYQIRYYRKIPGRIAASG
jgi:uncharacterized SAM-binding protein YcdF (DUF218 family)